MQLRRAVYVRQSNPEVFPGIGLLEQYETLGHSGLWRATDKTDFRAEDLASARGQGERKRPV